MGDTYSIGDNIRQVPFDITTLDMDSNPWNTVELCLQNKRVAEMEIGGFFCIKCKKSVFYRYAWRATHLAATGCEIEPYERDTLGEWLYYCKDCKPVESEAVPASPYTISDHLRQMRRDDAMKTEGKFSNADREIVPVGDIGLQLDDDRNALRAQLEKHIPTAAEKTAYANARDKTSANPTNPRRASQKRHGNRKRNSRARLSRRRNR